MDRKRPDAAILARSYAIVGTQQIYSSARIRMVLSGGVSTLERQRRASNGGVFFEIEGAIRYILCSIHILNDSDKPSIRTKWNAKTAIETRPSANPLTVVVQHTGLPYARRQEQVIVCIWTLLSN